MQALCTVRALRRPSIPLVSALLVLSLTLSACGAGKETEAQALAEDFLADLRAGAWQAAYGRMHGDLQAACGSAADLEQQVNTALVRPQSWEFTDISAQNHTGYLQLTITTQDDVKRYSNLALEREGGAFRVRDWRNDAHGVCGEF